MDSRPRFFAKSLETVLSSDGPEDDRLLAVYSILVDICTHAVADSKMPLSTAFALIAYTGHKHNLPGHLLFNAHVFRKEVTGSATRSPDALQLGARVVADFLRMLYHLRFSPRLLGLLPDPKIYRREEFQTAKFHSRIRVLVTGVDIAKQQLEVYRHNSPGTKASVVYGLPNQDSRFAAVLENLESTFGFPVEANLIDVEENSEGLLQPKAFVIEPDFLLDITSIAGCFEANAVSIYPYLLRKFLPRTSSIYLLIGNVANYFLDELMGDASISFKSLLRKVFHLDPLAFAQLNDADARKLISSIEIHFRHLKKVVSVLFPEQGILPAECYLEPSFYSEMHGLQGRLDVLYDHPKRADEATIIELKSGKIWRPNTYGLNAAHYVQTLLYDLIIKAVSRGKLKPTNYILYSSSEEDPLRFAPAVRSLQYEALAVRNVLLALDRKIARLDEDLNDFDKFRSLWNQGRKPTGFVRRDLDLLYERFRELNTLEKKYFMSCIAFIAREHRLAKIGRPGVQTQRGQASLWLQSVEEKEDQFSILRQLTIVQNDSQTGDPTMTFGRTPRTNALANFRRGDLALVYPDRKGVQPLHNQLFKGTIIKISQTEVVVRLRARQFNHSLFSKHTYWSIEHDMLDSSFSGLYRSAYQFTAYPSQDRARFLTSEAPAPPDQVAPGEPHPEMTSEQNRIFQKMLSASDYFLLWGPPGTGKTSIMLKHLVGHILRHTDETQLILAYTNRAVDEICGALESLGDDIASQYFRIGSRHSCDPRFHGQLLTSKLQGVSKRQDLVRIVRRHRIVVATVSSFLGKAEFLQMISFDRIILDEATQILEPTMSGLLPQFPKKILIGDHRQLASVVVQSQAESKVDDDDLHAVGLNDLATSYFERMLQRCRSMNWDWAFDQLTHQGRMHRELMQFPSEMFYRGTLKVLPELHRQQAAMPYGSGQRDRLSMLLAQHRVLFLPVDSQALYRSKTNSYEAETVVKIVKSLYAFETIWSESVGIITPFRAQIALIRSLLDRESINSESLTIDTVERYQGGARDIIIISLCVTSPEQMETLVARSAEGVDRKFNVALTRAREQLIVLGDPEVLEIDPVYREFISRYRVDSLLTTDHHL